MSLQVKAGRYRPYPAPVRSGTAGGPTLDGVGKAGVGGGVAEDLVAGLGKGGDAGSHAAQDAVSGKRCILLQGVVAKTGFVPVDDGVKIPVAENEVAEDGVFNSLFQGRQSPKGRWRSPCPQPTWGTMSVVPWSAAGLSHLLESLPMRSHFVEIVFHFQSTWPFLQYWKK